MSQEYAWWPSATMKPNRLVEEKPDSQPDGPRPHSSPWLSGDSAGMAGETSPTGQAWSEHSFPQVLTEAPLQQLLMVNF